MNVPTENAERLRFLTRVIEREIKHLQTTDNRLFPDLLTRRQLEMLDEDPDLAERLEAFISRFGRLQDTLGDKLLPQLLQFVEEKPATMIDNLVRAERLGWISSTDQWLAARRLRNQMVHEYIENLDLLLDALNTGHALVPMLIQTGFTMLAEIQNRLH